MSEPESEFISPESEFTGREADPEAEDLSEVPAAETESDIEVLIVFSQICKQINTRRIRTLQLSSCPRGLLNKKKNAVGTIADKPKTFLTDEDYEVIREFFMFRNATCKMLKLGLPSIVSLFFLPFALLLYSPLIIFFWSGNAMPNVNDAILCYLTPAGFIYAVAFGFAYQEAVNKQQNIRDLASQVVGSLQQICELVRLCQLSPQSSYLVYYRIKDNCIQFIKAITEASNNPDGRHRFEGNLLGLAHQIEDLAENTPLKPEAKVLNETLRVEIIKKCLMTDTQIISKWPYLEGRIKVFHWFFLVLLGYFAFFGILLLRAESVALEQSMCLITVVTISLFSYVLADLDSPFHGVFTVNIDIVTDFIFNIEKFLGTVTSEKS